MEDASAVMSLPDDPAILKQIILMRTREIDERTRERDEWKTKHDEKELQRQQIEILRLRIEMELLWYKKRYYGPRADRLTTPGDVAQMLLEFATGLESRPVNPEDVPAGPPGDPENPPLSEDEVKTVRRVRRGRRNLAEFNHLPVTRKEYGLSEKEKPCPCCGEMREQIGQESSWQIEYIPGRFERIEHVQIKYACRHCEQNAQNPQIELADKPASPIDKGMAAPGLLAHVVTSKFADYLPLYRLEGISGWRSAARRRACGAGTWRT